jgi:hypothetical protein
MRASRKLAGLLALVGMGVVGPWTLRAAFGSGSPETIAAPLWTEARGSSPSRILGDSLNEGPHVYWQSDSVALAFYHCEGEFLSSGWITAQEPFPFRGLCQDSNVEYVLSPRAPEVEPHTFPEVSRIFAVSDIHGEYQAFVDLLVNGGIIREDLSWAWGDGHLVVLGDILDRGGQVTECLWLVHRLEREARAAGGRVHFTLGNHEMMVLQRDLRYVHPRYLDGVVESSGVRYDDLFGPAMELGRWLRTKHTAVLLNQILFVHAGIGPEVVTRELDLASINEQIRAAIDLRSYDIIFNDMPGFLLDIQGPLWYRGYFIPTSAYPRATVPEVRQVLDYYGAHTVVVGHTDIGEIQAQYGGMIFGIDMSLERMGFFQGLLWEDGEFFKVQGDGTREPMGRGGAAGPLVP